MKGASAGVGCGIVTAMVKLRRLSSLLLDSVTGGSPVKHVGKALETSSEDSLPPLPSYYCCAHQQFEALDSIMDYGKKSDIWQAQGGHPKTKYNSFICSKLSHSYWYEVMTLRGRR